MKMRLRVEGYWVDIASESFEHFGKEFHDNLPDIMERGDTEDDNDWVDFDIESIEDLLKYMKAFEEFEMTIFVSCRTEEVDISYTLCNKKGWQHKDKQVFTRIEIKRGVVAEKLNRRVERAIEILQEERIDFGK